MELDRNINPDGCGKYVVINLRKLNGTGDAGPFARWSPEVAQAFKTLEQAGALEWGCTSAPDEFFLIKLKDRYAEAGLKGYAEAAAMDDTEYAASVRELASRAGLNSPFCKKPD